MLIYGSSSHVSTGISITAQSSMLILLYNVDHIHCCLLKEGVGKSPFLHQKCVAFQKLPSPSLCQHLD